MVDQPLVERVLQHLPLEVVGVEHLISVKSVSMEWHLVPATILLLLVQMMVFQQPSVMHLMRLVSQHVRLNHSYVQVQVEEEVVLDRRVMSVDHVVMEYSDPLQEKSVMSSVRHGVLPVKSEVSRIQEPILSLISG